jgi:predicted Fe-S protein YdhL (DUF1289 family)
MPISSPCTKQCRLDPASRLCVGCLRTIDEIQLWPELSEARRLAIMATLPARQLGTAVSSDPEYHPAAVLAAG